MQHLTLLATLTLCPLEGAGSLGWGWLALGARVSMGSVLLPQGHSRLALGEVRGQVRLLLQAAELDSSLPAPVP